MALLNTKKIQEFFDSIFFDVARMYKFIKKKNYSNVSVSSLFLNSLYYNRLTSIKLFWIYRRLYHLLA